MQYLKQSTSVDVLIGPFVDDADGDTPATGLTLDVELSKNGQALADSESAAPTHDSAGTVDGYYNCVLGTTDTATLGTLTLVVHHADALPIRHDYMVVTANWWDSMCGSDTLEADLTEIGGVAQSATDLKDFADAGYDPGTNKITGVVLADTVTDVTNGVSLANDAITAAKFDQSTAHPMANANGSDLTEVGGDGAQLVEAGGTGDQLTAINLPNQTMDIVGNITGNLSGSIGSNIELGPAEVNTEVVDVLKTDTISEHAQGIPPTTPTFEEAVMYLYMALTKKVDVDASLKEFYNNAGAVIWKKTLADDATNYNEDKGQSGP